MIIEILRIVGLITIFPIVCFIIGSIIYSSIDMSGVITRKKKK